MELSDRLRSLPPEKQKLLRRLLERDGVGASLLPIAARGEGAAAPLSHAQRSLWFMTQLAPESPFYNHPVAFRLAGPLDVAALEWACSEIVRRHAVLRAVFPVVDGLPVQEVLAASPVAIARTDLTDLPPAERLSRFEELAGAESRRPFDLAAGPLLRLALYRFAEQEHVLLRVVHHMVWDGWSSAVFDRELEALYAARCRGRSSPLAPLPLQYTDYARWQRERLAEESLEAQIAGWRRQLDGVPTLALPTDRPRPDRQTFEGGAVLVELPTELADRLEALSQDAGVTLFMTLFAAFQVLLARYTGQERIVVGTPIANRVRREFEGMIGYFANVVVLATDLSGDPTFGELLARVKEVTAWAYAHQEIPFELLVEKLAVARDPSRNPIFQVMFALHSELAPPPQLAGLTVEALTLGRGTSHFDLEWHLWGNREQRQREGVSGIITYNRDLYDEATVVRMLDDFKVLLAAVVADSGRPLSAFPVSPLAGQVWLAKHEEIEAAALAEPAVEACRVLRQPAGGGEELVAYVVWSQQPSPESLLARWREALPLPLPPLRVVAIDRLPLSDDGWIDDAALARLDPATASAPGEPPPLHLSDLLADWRPGRGEEHTTKISAPASPAGEAPAGPPAYADGGPLVLPDDAPRTFGEALVRAAAAWPERGITVIGDAEQVIHLSYPQLLARARSILSGLRASGLGPRDSVVLHLERLGDHLACFWACVLGGIVPVTVARPATYDRKSSVLSKLWNIWELLGRPPVLTSDRLLPFLAGVPALYHEAGQGEGFALLSVDELERHPPAADLYAAAPEDVVFHQLTSGSTGIPKCIQETHRGIVHHIHGARVFNGYTSDDVDLNWLPFDHVVPTLTCHLKDTYLGLRQVQVRTEVVLADPLRWLELIETHRVTHSWSPNFGFKLVCDALSRAPQRRFDLSSLVKVINAGEQITLPVVEEFLRRTAPFGFRPEAMQPSFGMAEVCTCMTFRNGFSLARDVHRIDKSSLGGRLEPAAADRPGAERPSAISFIDLGPPVPGVEIRIAGPDGQVLPERVIGRLQIRGAVVTPGYLRNPEANREAFVGDGWFDSGDLGFMAAGSLTLTGRQKEMIIIRGANFYCYEIEDVVNGLDGVEPTFSAAVAVDDAQTGTEGLAVFFVPRRPGIDPALIAAVRNAVAHNFGVAPAAVVPLTRETFPKTTSGKIQRTQLKKGLAAGAFDALLKEVDLATASDNTLPRWFLEPIWRRKEPAVRARGPLGGATLVLLDGGGLGAALLGQMGDAEQSVRVAAGDAFARFSRESYAIDPRREQDFAALVAALRADGLAIARVVHLWPCDRAGDDAEAAQLLGSYSLLSLTQALVQVQGGARTVRLFTAADGAPEHAPLLGLVKVLPQEWPWLECRHVELPLEDLEAAARCLVGELAVLDKDREVAYRDGRRCIRRLAPREPQAAGELPFAPAGMVLISGGLGGIGFHLARHLATARASRLLLVGRTRLDGEEPEEEANEADADEGDAIATRTGLAERRERLAELRGLGGEVAYEAVDVADAEGLREAVQRWEERWGTRLAGAIHLAGVFPSRLLAEETRESFAATLRPKLLGTLNLRRLLPSDAPFVVFGSNLAFFGGVATGAYAAAGNFVEAAVAADRRNGGRSYCFAWSNWDEVGMSRGYLLKPALRERGYRMIGAAQGVSSWRVGMGQPAPVSWLIGLDPRRINVRRHVEGPAAPLPAAVGSPVPGAASARGAAPAAPGTALEKAIAAIWREVLQVEEVGIHQSFFDLGGQSMLLARVLFLLQQRLQRHLGLVELLRYPTIAALARHLGEEGAERRPTYDDARHRAQQLKRRQQEPPAWRRRRA